MLVLVVEDDEDYGAIVAYTVQKMEHDVVVARDGASALRFAAQKDPHLAIVDMVLPDMGGHDVLAGLRRISPNLPVMFLSALNHRDDIVSGLEAGADDYLGKPFYPSELLARLKALSRRLGPNGTPGREGEVLRVGELEVHCASGRVLFRGEDAGCTPLEVALLTQLCRYPEQVLSHAFLLEQIWGLKGESDSRLIKARMHTIRQKLRRVGADEDLVRTVMGVGYSIAPVPAPAA
jgi:DNA-binding response OmpR family regulator